MTVGIAYANLGHPSRDINDNFDDFRDMVWSFFGAGSSLQELYVSHDKMKPEFWPVLAEAAKWSKGNENILKDTHWIGGSPINLEVYGFASWSPEKGIITLRNPADNLVEYNLNLKHVLEIPNSNIRFYTLTSARPDDLEFDAINVGIEKDVTIKLQAFETKVLEAIPIEE